MNQINELPTRERILHMLKISGPLSAKEITSELQITEMAVRRHLGTMERDGLIESKMIRQTLGRPTSVFGLTELAEGLFPKNYHSLTLDLLGELENEGGEETIKLLFEKRRDKLKLQYESSMEGIPFAEKVKMLAQIQNENGYMTECEQNEDGDYVLKEHNCPISQIANRYNHACECELSLFKSLLDTEVKRTECLAQDGERCIYIISNRK
ncbi:helix-turn-helix transcriptional regulator [Paenibacillus bouchesdurhonensis]|uniref:helix-turn-helix transcriptional regulator n=1 Tax=Paenibacillus bouchesdurhonensis TaxID=1870990 RepID=UPI000DA621B5|nr:helix-turn-helix domain-containing protein [Paenibacillus bouchesdurhonensis]